MLLVLIHAQHSYALLRHGRFRRREAHISSTSETSSVTSTNLLMLMLLPSLLSPWSLKFSVDTECSMRTILSCVDPRLTRNWSSERLTIVVVIAQTKLLMGQ